MRTYHRDKNAHYVHRKMNSDEAYNGRSLTLSIQSGAEDALQQAQEISRVLLDLPGSFSGMLIAHMRRTGVTREKLAKEFMISDTTIKRMRTSERELTLDQVTTVCIGLHIPSEYSFDLIEKAGFGLRNTPKYLIYRSILQTIYMEKIAMIQKLLVKCDCSELKLKEESE